MPSFFRALLSMLITTGALASDPPTLFNGTVANPVIMKTRPTFDPNMTKTFGRAPACPSAIEELVDGRAFCPEILVPMAYTLAGGQCSALLQHTGWFRSALVNPTTYKVSQPDLYWGASSLSISSSSGGTMFSTRYLTLLNFPSGTKWVFPCYMLTVRYRELCTFHQSFGGLANVCDSEQYEVVVFAMELVYKNLMEEYGGSFGVASGYLYCYFPFINSLPLSPAAKQSFHVFINLYTMWSSLYNAPMGWSPSNTRISPGEAMPYAPYNFGFGSYLSRASHAWVPTAGNCVNPIGECDVHWCNGCAFYHNFSTSRVAGQSAMMLSGMVMMPFAFAGKSWDALTGINKHTTQTKVLSMLVSYMVVKRLMKQHILDNEPTAPYCLAGCPVMDAGMIDNGPLTPSLAYLSKLPKNIRPTLVFQNGPSVSFGLYNFQLGKGPLDVWTGGGMGGNMCPFTQMQWCSVITALRKIAVQDMSGDLLTQYRGITNAYAVWVPEAQLMTAFCGDPMTYDTFKAKCQASSVCNLLVTMLPSKRSDIEFTIEPSVLYLTVVYIASTTLSKDFVREYVPAALIALPYFNKFDMWFPAYAIMGTPEKGGMAYTKAAGHPFMDYMTYLNVRLSKELFEAKMVGWKAYTGAKMACGWKVYDELRHGAVSETDFVLKQQSIARKLKAASI